MPVFSKAVFLGSKQLGLSVFRAIHARTSGLKWTIIHPDDSADPRSNLADFRGFADQCGVQLLVAASPSRTRAMLAELRPDVALVCGWYWMIDAQTRALAPHGFWGIHNSLLPKYRGGSPLVWSILNGEAEVGSTVFELSEGMDDGRVLHQVRVECGPDDRIGDLLPRIEARLVAEVPGKWQELVTDQARLLTQDESQATYCGLRLESDGLIDWKRDARRVHDFIRAQAPPYPCAFSYLDGQEIRFARARVHERIFHGTPGQVLQRNPVLIACGEGSALEVLEVRVNGEPLEPATAFKSIKGRLTDVRPQPQTIPA